VGRRAGKVNQWFGPRPAGQAGVNVRDVPHAGYKVIGDKTLKLLTMHIVDKGKPMTVPAN
jgi:hypothetical protein